MTVKLTRHIREEVRKDMLRHRFGDEFKQLVADRAALALDLLHVVFPKKDRELAATFPKGWLPSISQVQVQVAGSYDTIPLSGDGLYGDIRQGMPKGFRADAVWVEVPAKISGGCLLNLRRGDGHDELIDRHERLENQATELAKQIGQARRIIDAALAKATTVNKMREIWPEAAPFLERFDEAPQPVPALPTEELNRLLNLPKEEAA